MPIPSADIVVTLDELAERIRRAGPNERSATLEAFKTACRDYALDPVIEAGDRNIDLMNLSVSQKPWD